MFSQYRPCRAVLADAQYCELMLRPGDLNRYTLTGCLPQRADPLPLAFATDGASYAGAILAGTERGRDNLPRHRCCARRRLTSLERCRQ